jgi:hypothetical protein
MTAKQPSGGDTVHTRASIVRGLQSGGEDRWQEFYRPYAPVLRSFALNFDLNALKEWPAREVACSLGVGLANVYLTKHRVSGALKKELERLERQMDRGL